MSLSVDIRVALPEFELRFAQRLDRGVLALLGPSGAGKTTVLEALAGLSSATGRITLGDTVWRDSGRDVDVATRQRGVGYAFQDLALFPNLSARENVAWGATGSRASRRARADLLLERLGLAELAERRPGRLSGGERRRVALARALAGPRRLLLLDEPMAGLDRASRGRALGLIREEATAMAAPVLIATHDVAVAADLADEVVVMERGQVVQRGTLERIRAAPASDFAASL
jgi:molybdate transport system ATP-binding protein